MKIRHPFLIKLVGFVVAWVVRLWISTLRYRHRWIGANWTPSRAGGLPGRFLYAFWHETMLIPAHHYGRSDFWVLISQHADGRLIAEACRHLGFRVVNGSTTRGGVEAVRQMTRLVTKGHVGITPDGPRGPRRRLQPGIIYLAARTGLPIIPNGFAFGKAWRMKSWDRLALPCPFSEVVFVSGEPIHVPADADRETLETYRLRVETEMARVTDAAERLIGRSIAAQATLAPAPADEARRAA